MTNKVEIVNGKEYPVMTWHEIVKKYSGLTVYFVNPVNKLDLDKMYCTVVGAYSNDDIDAIKAIVNNFDEIHSMRVIGYGEGDNTYVISTFYNDTTATVGATYNVAKINKQSVTLIDDVGNLIDIQNGTHISDTHTDPDIFRPLIIGEYEPYEGSTLKCVSVNPLKYTGTIKRYKSASKSLKSLLDAFNLDAFDLSKIFKC